MVWSGVQIIRNRASCTFSTADEFQEVSSKPVLCVEIIFIRTELRCIVNSNAHSSTVPASTTLTCVGRCLGAVFNTFMHGKTLTKLQQPPRPALLLVLAFTLSLDGGFTRGEITVSFTVVVSARPWLVPKYFKMLPCHQGFWLNCLATRVFSQLRFFFFC